MANLIHFRVSLYELISLFLALGNHGGIDDITTEGATSISVKPISCASLFATHPKLLTFP